jgi:hypothetical protein
MSVGQTIVVRVKAELWRSSSRLPGIVTTPQLRSAGASAEHVRTLVRRGDLIRLARGVYATAEFAGVLRRLPVGEGLLAGGAAVTALSRGAVVSHQAAAQIHELDLLLPPPAHIAITRPPGNPRSSRVPGVLVHSAALPAGHVGGRLGVPVTTVSRTVVDLARTLSFREGVVVADSALRQNRTSKKDLRAVVAGCPRWPGIQQAKEVVEFADGLAESVLESIARVVFRDCGLPPPQLQVEVSRDGVTYRVDFMWKQFRTVAEVDGRLKYDDRSRFAYERRRDIWLRNAGYEVVHFTWQEITTQHQYVAATLRAAFRRGSRDARSG